MTGPTNGSLAGRSLANPRGITWMSSRSLIRPDEAITDWLVLNARKRTKDGANHFQLAWQRSRFGMPVWTRCMDAASGRLLLKISQGQPSTGFGEERRMGGGINGGQPVNRLDFASNPSLTPLRLRGLNFATLPFQPKSRLWSRGVCSTRNQMTGNRARLMLATRAAEHCSSPMHRFAGIFFIRNISSVETCGHRGPAVPERGTAGRLRHRENHEPGPSLCQNGRCEKLRSGAMSRYGACELCFGTSVRVSCRQGPARSEMLWLGPLVGHATSCDT
ncbi:hypothetical protein LY76DRAFT_263732 [Colletotrichum caudatum]|nr:hypothetical protein LY76DRAFT_263732 [Colletotrichum caudatum]